MELETEDKLTINKAFATKYKKKKEAEELSRLRDLHGDKVALSDSSESSEESEDEEGAWSAQTEAEFLRTLSLLKNKDPRIYDKSATFYSTPSTTVATQGQRSKVIHLRDYERERLLQKGSKANLSDSEEEGNPPASDPQTYSEEQEALRAQFKMAIEETNEPLLTIRTKTSVEKAEEEQDYQEWLRKNQGHKDLEGLLSYWGNPLLDQGEKFLRDYILSSGHHDNIELSVPTYNEVVGVASEESGGSDTEDEEALEKQEEFERKYNFRYEEPEADLIKSYPRTIASSVRAVDNTRRTARLQRQERKKLEKEREKEELRRLKNLQKQEVKGRLKQLADITGNSVESLGSLAVQLDLDEDFDPEMYDQTMGEVFGTEYYEGEEEGKPPVVDEDELWEEPHCEHPAFNMDADFDDSISNSKPKKGKRSRVTFNPSAESANVPVMEGTFKYRPVMPNDFGLSTEEILLCENRELNGWVSLSKMVQYRSEEEEKKDRRIFRKRGRDWSRKKRYLTSAYPIEEAAKEEETKTKKKSKGKGHKRKGKSQHKLSESRLKSYGV